METQNHNYSATIGIYHDEIDKKEGERKVTFSAANDEAAKSDGQAQLVIGHPFLYEEVIEVTRIS